MLIKKMLKMAIVYKKMKATFKYCYSNMAFLISKTVSGFELLHHQAYFLNC